MSSADIITLTPLARSRNIVLVSYDLVNSHAVTHFEDTPQLKDLVIEVIGRLDLHGQEIAQDFNMGRIVGTCDVVSVGKDDEIVYAKRKNRDGDGLMPFTKTSLAEPSQNVSIHLIPKSDGNYILSSAWIGTFDDEPFPLSANANEKSVDFWNKHAFVYGSQEIIRGTETNLKPW